MEYKYIISRFRKSHVLKLLKEVLAEESSLSKSGKKYRLVSGYSFDKVCSSIKVCKSPVLVGKTDVSEQHYKWSATVSDRDFSSIVPLRVFTHHVPEVAAIGYYRNPSELTPELVDEWIRELIRKSGMVACNISL